MLLTERLMAGERVFSAWSSVPDSLNAEGLAATPFDAVCLDMQHGAHHEDSVMRCLGPIIASGKPGLVRVPVDRFDMAARALDFGAQAVIAPMVNSVADARAFAQAMKYPPVGKRSWGPHLAMGRSGFSGPQSAWLDEANRKTLAFAMIETREALDAVDEILAVAGIDGVFVGPSDFSIALTDGKTVDPSLESMMEAIAHISARAHAVGKHAGIYVVDPKLVQRYSAMGYRLFALGNEQNYMERGAAVLLAAAGALPS